jgi:EAL domain-containing protein (putative c-di-GMP-specific phosphodiesterase class I)
VAEGVETAAQLAVVRSLGISAGQGYLLGRPGGTMRSDRVDLDDLEASGDLDELFPTTDRSDNVVEIQPRISVAS